MRTFYSCILILLCISGSISSQTIVEDGFEIVFKEAFNRDLIELSSSNYFIELPEGMKEVRIRTRIQAKPNKRTVFDANKFYVLSDEYKLQIRPYDVRHNALMHLYAPIEKLRKSDPKTKKIHMYEYDPRYEDSFDNYIKPGYYCTMLTVSFGKKEYNQNIKYFYKPEKRRRNVMDFYFSIPEKMKKGAFYYGNTLIAEFEVE